MEKHECIQYARRIAQGLAGAALHEFSLLAAGLPDSRDKKFLEGIATWMIERNLELNGCVPRAMQSRL